MVQLTTVGPPMSASTQVADPVRPTPRLVPARLTSMLSMSAPGPVPCAGRTRSCRRRWPATCRPRRRCPRSRRCPPPPPVPPVPPVPAPSRAPVPPVTPVGHFVIASTRGRSRAQHQDQQSSSKPVTSTHVDLLSLRWPSDRRGDGIGGSARRQMPPEIQAAAIERAGASPPWSWSLILVLGQQLAQHPALHDRRHRHAQQPQHGGREIQRRDVVQGLPSAHACPVEDHHAARVVHALLGAWGCRRRTARPARIRRGGRSAPRGRSSGRRHPRAPARAA